MKDRVSIDFKDGVADVRLIRADKMNALDPAMFEGIIEAGDQLAKMKGLRCVVLSGEGKAFCAGHDLKEMGADLRDAPVRALFDHCSAVMTALTRLPQPVIARVHGIATARSLGSHLLQSTNGTPSVWPSSSERKPEQSMNSSPSTRASLSSLTALTKPFAGSCSTSAASNAERMRRRTSIALSSDLTSGAKRRQSSCPKYE